MAYVTMSALPYKKNLPIEIKNDETYPVHYLNIGDSAGDQVCLHLNMNQIEDLHARLGAHISKHNAAEMVKMRERMTAASEVAPEQRETAVEKVA